MLTFTRTEIEILKRATDSGGTKNGINRILKVFRIFQMLSSYNEFLRKSG